MRNLFKRLKTLWRLSAIDLDELEREAKKEPIITLFTRKNKMATIVEEPHFLDNFEV